MEMSELEKLNDKCNKLKALVIKEKKANVENTKLIAELKANYEASKKENEQLSSQLQRLSMSIGELQSSQESDMSIVEQRYQEEIKSLKHELIERETDYEETAKATKEEMESVLTKLMRANERFEEESTYSSSLKKQKEELQTFLEDRDATIESLKLAKAELGKSLLNLEERMQHNSEELNTKLRESDQVILDLESKLKSSFSDRDSNSDLEMRLSKHAEQQKEDQNAIKLLNEEVLSLKERIIELSKVSENASEEYETEKNSLEEEKRKMEELCNNLNENLADLQAQFEHLRDDKEHEISSLKAIIEHHEVVAAQSKEAQTLCQEKDQEIVCLKETIDNLETVSAQNEWAQEQCQEKDEEISNLKNRIQNLKVAMQESMEGLKLKDDEIKESNSKLYSLEEEILILESRMKTVTDDSTVGESESKDEEAVIASLKEELNEKSAEIEYYKNLSEHSKTSDKEIDCLGQSVEPREKLMNEDEAGNLEIIVACLKEQLIEKNREIESYKEGVEQMKTLNLEIDDLRLTMESKDKIIEESNAFRKDCERFRSESLETQQIVARLNDEIAELQSSSVKLETENKNLLCEQHENENSIDKYSKMFAELQSLLKITDKEYSDEHPVVADAVKELIKLAEEKRHSSRDELEEASLDVESQPALIVSGMLDGIQNIFQQWLEDDNHFKSQFTERDELKYGDQDLNPIFIQVHDKLAHEAELAASNTVLLDGVQKITTKCNDLEETVNSKEEDVKRLKAKLQETTEALEELESDISTRDDQVEQLQAMVEDTRNIVRALEREKDALQSEIMELTSRSEEKETLLGEEVRELKAMISSQEDNIHMLQVSGESLRDNELEFKLRLDEAQNRSFELNQQLESLEKHSQNLEMNLSDLTSQVNQKDDHIQSQSAIVVELEKAVASQSREIAELHGSIDQLKEETDIKDRSLKSNLKEFEEQINLCDQLRADLHFKTEELENERVRHEKEEAELTNILNQKSENNENVEVVNKLLQDSKNSESILNSKISEVNQKLHDLENSLHMKEDENQRLVNDLNEMRDNKRDLESQITEMQKSCNLVMDLNKKIDYLETSHESLSEQNRQLLTREQAHETAREESAIREKDINSQLLKLRKEYEALTSEHESISNDNEIQRGKREEAINLVNTLNGRIEDVQEENTLLSKKFHLLTKDYENLQELHQEATTSAEKIMDELNSVKESLAIESDRHRQLEAQTEQLRILNNAQEQELNHQRKLVNDSLSKSNSEEEERFQQIDKERQAAVEKVAKLKVLLIKLKKDLADSVREKEESLNQAASIKSELVNLQETLSTVHGERMAIEEMSNKERSQFEQALSNMRETSDNENNALRAQIIVAEQELNVLREQRQQLMAERLDAEEKLSNERSQWSEERDLLKKEVDTRERHLKNLEEGLHRAEQEGRQRNVMDLELAEFERTVESLKDQLDVKDDQMKVNQEELRNRELQVQSLMGQVRELEGLRNQADERGNKLKQLLMKTKRELADVRKKEEEQRSRSAGLSTEAETITTQLEECKLELASVTAERQTLEERVGELRSRITNQQRSHESSQKSLKAQLDMVQEEKHLLTNEFDAYKAKAQAAFKRDRETGSSSAGRARLSNSEDAAVIAVRQRLEGVVERLKEKLEEKENQIEASNNELELLQREHNRMVEKSKKMENDFRMKETQWSQQLSRISNENSVSENEHLSVLQHLTLENESLLRNYKEQLQECRSEHANEVQALRSQIEMGESENERLRELCLRLQQQYQQLQEKAETARDATQSLRQPAIDMPLEGLSAMEMNGSAPALSSTPRNIGQRMQAEGMEQPSDDGSRQDRLTHSRDSSYVTFEQLLSQPPVDTVGAGPVDVSDTQSITSVATDATMESMRSEINRSQKRCDHLSELLEESESMVQHLSEQASVLKTEIRRHELNQHREKHLSNSEYVKNVVMKFLTLGTVDERRRLVPVLATVLSLTKEEKNILFQVAEIRTTTSGDPAQTGQGWSSYFQWAGLT